MKKYIILSILFLFNHCVLGFGQEVIVDQVIAVIGNNIILKSDIENQYIQYRAQGYSSDDDLKCDILESRLVEKLLVNQAAIDSIQVNPAQVEMQFNQRYQLFVDQIGSEERLEEYWNKPIMEIKDDLREIIYEQLTSQQMQMEIVGDIKVTPSEIRSYYNKIPKDSLPLIDADLEICQIVRYPASNEQAVIETRERLLDLRRRIIDGEDFATLAILYSEGPSAPNGGEIGFFGRAEMDPEFAKVAFSLKNENVSRIVESEFGFHIIQLIEKKDEKINCRHILLQPKVTPEEIRDAKRFLDSIANLVRYDSISFENAAGIYSGDVNTKMNGGLVLNPQTGTSKFLMTQLGTQEYTAVNKLKIGEISDSFASTDQNGREIYKIIKLKSRSDPHKANLKDDYLVLQEMTLVQKQQDILINWIEEKQKSTYIRIYDSYKNCEFLDNGWLK